MNLRLALRSTIGRAALWMAVACFLFALMGLFARLAGDHARWPEIAAARSMVGFLVALGVARTRGVPVFPRQRGLGWMRSLAGTGAMVCSFSTLAGKDLALGDAAALGATSTILIALGARFYSRETSAPGLVIALPMALAGIFLIARPSFASTGGAAGIALAGAVFSALAKLTIRELGDSEAPESVAGHFALVSTIVMTALAIPHLAAPGLAGLGWMLGTGLAGGFAQLAMTRAYASDNAGRISVLGHLTTVMTQALGALFLDEIPTGRQLAGAGLIVTAGVLLTALAIDREG